MESVAILGATGSIGKSSLDVISRYPDRFTVYAVTANSSVKKLAQAAKDSGEIIIKGKSSKEFSTGDFDSYRTTFPNKPAVANARNIRESRNSRVSFK